MSVAVVPPLPSRAIDFSPNWMRWLVDLSVYLANRQSLTDILSGEADITFGSIPAQGYVDKTISVPGALQGDVVSLGVPNDVARTAGLVFFGFVSAAGVVTVRAANVTGSPSVALPQTKVRADVWTHGSQAKEPGTRLFLTYFGIPYQGVPTKSGTDAEDPLYGAERGSSQV